MLADKRLLIAEAGRSGIGRLFYNKIDSYLQELASFLDRAMAEGHLHMGDPKLAAHQFRALVEAEILEPCLLGAQEAPPPAAAISRAAENAVTTFLRTYAPDRDLEISVTRTGRHTARVRQDSTGNE